MKRAACLVAALLLCAGGGRAQEADEEAGLRLADQTPERVTQAKPWTLSVEPATVWARNRADGHVDTAQRLSVDLTLQGALSQRWRWTLADRLDLRGPERLSGERDAVNTLKELYVSTRPGEQTAFDAGRINLRNGVAYGYNPTDHFRAGSIRSVTSVDPASLRENRLGTAMLRGQRLWSGGSVTAIVAPRLADAPSEQRFSADLGATNNHTQWLLAWSQRWAQDFAPQWLLYGGRGGNSGPRLGLNLTRLLSKACVAHLEWSGGRSPSLWAQAQGDAGQDDSAFRQQLSTGLTCSNARNQSLTVEYQHNGLALGDEAWRRLRAGPLPPYLAYLQQGQRLQEPLTRDRLFMQWRWENAGIAQLDLSGFFVWSLADHSRVAWVETRYNWGSTDLALQWQFNTGRRLTEFGAQPQSQVVQLLLRHYF